MSPSIVDNLRTASAGILAGNSDLPRLTVQEWHKLIAWATDQRVVGLVRSQALLQPQPSSVVAALNHEWRLTVAAQLAFTHELSRLAEVFGEAQLDYLVLKGAVSSRLLYECWDQRGFGDIDVLVHPADMDRAIDTLCRIGGRPTRQAVDPRNRRYLRSLPICMGSGVEIDLHRAIACVGGLVVADYKLFFERSQVVNVGLLQVPAPSFPAMLVHAALNSVANYHNAGSIADIYRLLSRVDTDDATFLSLMRPPNVAVAFSLALQEVAVATGQALPERWTPLAQPKSAIRQKLISWALQGRDRATITGALATSHRFRKVRSALAPGPEFLREVGLQRGQYVYDQLSRLAAVVRPGSPRSQSDFSVLDRDD